VLCGRSNGVDARLEEGYSLEDRADRCRTLVLESNIETSGITLRIIKKYDCKTKCIRNEKLTERKERALIPFKT
jgi:hypothetical protein